MSNLKELKVKYNTLVLSNNIRLDVYEKEGAPIEVRFNILGGDVFCRDKTKKGIAHFMEHIFCAGTKEYPSKDKVAMYLDSFGGVFGGMTWVDKMSLWLSCPDAVDAEKLFQILSSCLKDPLINKNILEAERGSITTEYNQKYAKNIQKVYKKFTELIFNNTEYSYPGLGTVENINSFTSDDLGNWVKENIVGGKIGICISGDISIEKSSELCEKYFSFINKSEVKRPKLPISEMSLIPEYYSKENSIAHIEVKEDNSFLILGFRMEGKYSENHLIYSILNTILGNRRSSLLNKKLRYETGLSYSPSSEISRYFDTGYFSIEINCKFEDINKVIEIINLIITEEFEKELTRERFEMEQNRYKKILKSQYEKNSEFLNFGSIDTLTTNTDKSFDQLINERDSLDYSDFLKIGKEFLRNKNWYIVYYAKEKVDLTNISK